MSDGRGTTRDTARPLQIGELLKRYRLAAHLTQEELSCAVEVIPKI